MTFTDRLLLPFFVVLGLAYASVTIALAPGFYFDDYLVFTYIEKTIQTTSFPGPEAPFFLGVRPLFVLLLSVLYYFLQNPVTMKLFIVPVYLTLIVLFFYSVNNLAILYKVELKKSVLIPGMIFFISHTDIIYGVFWLSNLNELLLVFFYACTLYFIMQWIKSSKSLYFTLALMLFCTSLLTKQTGIHLPLFAGLILYLVPPPGKEETTKSQAKLLIATGTVFLILLSIFHLSTHSFYVTEYVELWKKPFALAGTILYIINPYFGLEAYNFFLKNYFLAALLASFSLGILGFAISRKLVSAKTIIMVILLLLLLFFPRLVAAGGDRLNSVQVYIFVLFGIVWLSTKRIGSQRLIKVIIIAGIAGGILYTLTVIGYYRFSDDFVKYTNNRYNNSIKNLSEKPIILVPPNTYNFPYLLHYSLHNSFGKVDAIIPPIYTHHNNTILDTLSFQKIIHAERVGDTLTVNFLNETGIFHYLKSDSLSKYFIFLRGDLQLTKRGYKSVSVIIRDEYRTLPIIYYNGSEWTIINNN